MHRNPVSKSLYGNRTMKIVAGVEYSADEFQNQEVFQLNCNYIEFDPIKILTSYSLQIYYLFILFWQGGYKIDCYFMIVRMSDFIAIL